MGLYIIESASIERDLLESLSLNAEEKEALQEATIILEDEDPFKGKSRQEIEKATGRALYVKLQSDKDSMKAFDQI